MESLQSFLNTLLGLDADSLSWYQMAARAALIYIAALAMVRVGEKRFLGKNTAFDVILGIILGSVVSRAINGSAEFLPTIVSGFILVGLHWLMAYLAFRSDRFGDIVKGTRRQLVQDGEIRWDSMRKSSISQNDLMEQVRGQAKQDDLSGINRVILERSGSYSVLPAPQPPRILEVTVQDGVQTIRIELNE